MIYRDLVPTWVVPMDKRDNDHPDCLICQLGVRDMVDELLKKGQTRLYIRQRLRYKFPKEYRVVRCIRSFDITYHQAHAISKEQRKVAVVARKDLMKERKTLAEVNEAVLGNIAKAIDLVTDLKPEELDTLKPKEKFDLFEKATKLLQGEKKLALEANKEKREESEWMSKLNELGSGDGSGNEG